MPEPVSTTLSTDRRERFRSFMKRFNPTAPPKTAIGDGLICTYPERSVYKKLAATADLSPGSQQLVVGGIGSGKTTELLLADQVLSAREGACAVYIDVSAETDLSAVSSGALLASLGLHLWRMIRLRFPQTILPAAPDLHRAAKQIEKAAYGSEEWVPRDPQQEPDSDAFGPAEPDDDGPDWHIVKHPGILKPPFPALRRDIKELAETVSTLTRFLKSKQTEVVGIFDGLDRLIKPDQFWAIAEQDLRAMRPLGFSVLAAGPLSVMYGQGRQIKDYFDEVHYLPPAIADPRESPFLLEVLRVRGAQDLLSEELMQTLCLASGGVLRDLISLVRNAAQNAYLDDADMIRTADVEEAVEQLGSSYLLGLGTWQKGSLYGLAAGMGFAPSDPARMELLVTRRVLELPESRYVVHPALASVLRTTGGEPE